MAHINLLPWREELRKEKQKEYITLMVITALLGGLLVFAGHLFMNNQIAAQNENNNYLNKEIEAVEARLKEIEELDKTRKALLDRMEVIQQLQASRPRIVHLFDDMVTTLPDGVYLTWAKQTDMNLELSGMAESNARVSSLMRNIDESEWLNDSRLTVIEADQDDPASRIRTFTVTAIQTDPQTDLESDTTGGTQ